MIWYACLRVQQIPAFCDSVANRWVFKATVYRAGASKGFVGYGDADPSNISPLVRGAEMRVAETRAVNRALRKAYGIGLCSVEELGSQSGSNFSVRPPNDHSYWTGNGNGNNGTSNSANSGQRLRDQLCILIRKYSLDPNLVKQYAADYCGTAALKDAGRELVASFISHLAESAQKNRDALSWHPQKPFLALRFGVLEPKEHAGQSISGRLYCTERALWKLNWFLRDFGYDQDLLGRDQVDDRACLNLQGVLRTSYTSLNGHSFQNLEAFAPVAEWEEISHAAADGQQVSEKF